MTLRMRNFRPLWLLVFLIVIIALTVCTVRAEEANPYRIVLTAPGGWTNNNAAVIKVSITDRGNIGWQRIEYRMNSGGWLECEDLFDQSKGEITVHDNGSFALRVTDPSGKTYEETATVTTIDLSAPVVTAVIYDQTLRIDVRDDLSGIGGVQVNSMLFTTVEGNVLEVELDQNMNKFEKLAIRAFDFAGNFSEPVTLENPHYEKPADPTPEPTATPTAKPTKKPTATAEASEPEETVRPVQPAATESTQHGLGSSLIYITDEDIPVVPVVTATPTAEPTAAPTPEPIIQTEYITIGPGMPYLADGNSHTLDVLYEDDWILVQYDITKEHNRIGYIYKNALPKDVEVPELALKSAAAVVNYDVEVTDDPLVSKAPLAKLTENTRVTCLGTMGDWTYIEGEEKGVLFRGFVPTECLSGTVTKLKEANRAIVGNWKLYAGSSINASRIVFNEDGTMTGTSTLGSGREVEWSGTWSIDYYDSNRGRYWNDSEFELTLARGSNVELYGLRICRQGVANGQYKYALVLSDGAKTSGMVFE